MGRLRIVLTVLLGAVFSSQDGISGSELYLTVRPGDNITLYCDCKRSTGVYIVWYRNCSHENQPPLVLRKKNIGSQFVITDNTSGFPRFHFVKNESSRSNDLLIKNITDSDQGLYYCGTEETNVVDKEKITDIKIYEYGNVTTWILFDSSTSEPPHPCGLCWGLLYTLCPAIAVVSCLITSILLWHLCQRTAKEPQIHQERPDTGRERRGNQDEDGLCYAALDIRQTSRRPKKKKDQSSDFSTYSAINTSRM